MYCGNTFYGASEELDSVSRALDRLSTNIRSSKRELWNMSAATIHNNAMKALRKKEERPYKPFVLPSESFEAIDVDTMNDVVFEREQMAPRFIEGEAYSLKGVSCDGFDMPTKVYKLVAIVKEFYGVQMDSVIMKQIGGEKGQIFTLSKNDCLHLGIEYEDGLQPFPMDMHWERIIEKVPFDPNDLSTSARSKVDNTIRYVLFRINGFKDFSDGYVFSPSGKLIKEEVFTDTLKIKNIEPIVYGNGYVDREYTILRSSIVYPKSHLFTHANFISQNDDVFVLLNLAHSKSKCIDEVHKNACIDRYFGIEPRYLKGIDPNKFFTIEWDESTAITIEQYESVKKEKLQKQRREEEAKRIRERAKRQTVNKISESIKGIKTFPNMPNLNNPFDSISSIDLYIKGVDNFMIGLDDALNSIIKIKV